MNVLTAEEVTAVEESVHEDLNGMRMVTVKTSTNVPNTLRFVATKIASIFKGVIDVKTHVQVDLFVMRMAIVQT